MGSHKGIGERRDGRVVIIVFITISPVKIFCYFESFILPEEQFIGNETSGVDVQLELLPMMGIHWQNYRHLVNLLVTKFTTNLEHNQSEQISSINHIVIPHLHYESLHRFSVSQVFENTK